VSDASAARHGEFFLRPATAADALCISVLATQVFLETYATDGIRPSLAREVLSQLSAPPVSALLAAPDTRFIVAERAGHMIGLAQLTLESAHERVAARPASELNRLYVHARFTGTGVGKALLGETEAVAAAAGAITLWLTAWAENRRALDFYARRGYADLGATPYVFEGERYENRVFAKPLKPGSGA
jgi:GNAT superfamily N-acetyltransferase